MITPKDIERASMTPEKRKNAKNDWFAFYIGRPLSYLLTVPFAQLNVSPNAVSILSIVPVLIGFVLMTIGTDKLILCTGWLMFFLWNLLDGVDGNLARYQKRASKLGDVYDAMSGYAAMALTFLAWGAAAAHHGGIFDGFTTVPDEIYLILGALSSIFILFPRLIMHKTITTFEGTEKVAAVKNKSQFGILKIIALNITSVAGLVQVFMIVSILWDMLDLFTVVYFFINTAIMICSLWTILRRDT